MPTSDGKVVITVDSNARQAATDFNTLDQSLKNVEKDGQQVAAGSNKMFGALGSLKGAVVAAGVAFAGMKLAQFAGDIFKVSSAFEQLNVKFQVLAGQQAGAQLVNDLQQLSKVTPLTTQGLANSATTLLAFGEASENVVSDLRMLGDLAGGNEEKLSLLTLAFSQAGSAGRLMGQDLLQMINAGFNPLEHISKKTGKSMFELRKEMEAGKIGFDQIKQAMIEATSKGGRFYDMMNKQSETLEGRLSTLSESWQMVAKSIGDFFLPAAKMAVNAMIKLGDAVFRLTKLNQTYSASIPNQSLDQLQLRLSEVNRMQEKWNNAIKNAPNIATKSLMVANYRKELEKLNIQEKQITDRIKSLSKSSGGTSKAQDVGFKSSAAIDFGGQIAHSRQQARAITRQVTQEELNDYQKLQNKVSELKNNLMIMATQGKNSGDLWTKSLQNYQAAQAQLDMVNKSIETTTTTQIGAYDALNNKISELKINLENMAVAGQAGTPAFDKMKNDYVEATNQMKQANRQVTNAMGIDWSNVGDSIRQDLASAITTPLREGETAFQRLGNVALNIISMVGQKMIEQLLEEISLTQVLNGVKVIGKALSFGLFANGDVFSGGKPQAFASGGVVSSPTLFPMKNGTGLMGEAGAEAIMPLKRTSSGRLGVEASGQSQPNINIYNQSQSQIETVTRPNGETDLFIRKVNNALASERTQSGFTKASSRQNSRGITAA